MVCGSAWRPWVAGMSRSRGTGPELAWVLVLEQQRGTAKLPGSSDRDGIERSRAPRHATAAQSNYDEETYTEQRGKRKGNGHGVFLTSARSCGGVQKTRIGGAEVESRRRRGGLTALLHEKFPCARG